MTKKQPQIGENKNNDQSLYSDTKIHTFQGRTDKPSPKTKLLLAFPVASMNADKQNNTRTNT